MASTIYYGLLAPAHNGNLINAPALEREPEYTGAIFQITIDSEVIACHIARARLNSDSVFEYIYFAGPDSYIDGMSVYNSYILAENTLQWKGDLRGLFYREVPQCSVLRGYPR